MCSQLRIAIVTAIFLTTCVCVAEEKKPATPLEELYIVPNPNAGQPAQAEAQVNPAPVPQALMPVADQRLLQNGQIPGTLNPNRKPGEPIIVGNGTQVPQTQNGAVAQSNQSQGAERSQVMRDYPVLRLPIDLPSSSIFSVATGFGRFQFSQDAKLETREIVIPLPVGYWPYANYLSAPQPQQAAPAGQIKP